MFPAKTLTQLLAVPLVLVCMVGRIPAAPTGPTLQFKMEKTAFTFPFATRLKDNPVAAP
jgi:hypothetical protein